MLTNYNGDNCSSCVYYVVYFIQVAVGMSDEGFKWVGGINEGLMKD